MATLMSAKGSKVCVDSRGDELMVTALADGTAQAGDACGVIAATNYVHQVTAAGSLDEFVGWLESKYNTDIDTAMTAAEMVELVIPQGGHLYLVHITDPSATVLAGEPMVLDGATAGEIVKVGDVETYHSCRLYETVVSGTTYAVIIYGA